MVNELANSNPKRRLLERLRDSSKPLSGEVLGRDLGMSRVAVHKHIRALKDRGYGIESGPRGYRLKEADASLLTPWEFSAAEQVTVLGETVSTMDEAHRMEAGPFHGDFTVAALRQTSGRGRRERTWISPEGGLWMTRVVHPGGSAIRVQKYVMAAAAGLAGLLREKHGVKAEVKWPNDVLADGGKIAGVLGEARLSGDRIRYLALGLGLNANNETADGAVSLKTLLGREVNRNELIRDWTASLDRLTSSRDFQEDGSPSWWNGLMTGIGKRASYIVEGGRISGRVDGVDGLGRLRLEFCGGSTRSIPAGDID